MIKSRAIKIYGMVIFILGYFFIPGLQNFMEMGLSFIKNKDFYGLRAYLNAYGAAAPIVSIFFIVVQSVIPFFPGMVLTITNAWLFGWKMGACYTWVGALLGAILDFSLARLYGKPIIEQMMRDKYTRSLNAYVDHHGAVAVLITRLTPIVPFKIVSYSAGLSNMPLKVFTLVTAVGQVPSIILFSVLGENILTNLNAMLAIMLLLMIIAGIVFKFRNLVVRWLYKVNK